MKKPKKDPIREGRIHNDAIADANGPEELVMGWHCYLDDKIQFPFQATCISPKIVSPLRKGETVEVQRMAPEDVCSADMLVLIRWQGRTMAVPLSQLSCRQSRRIHCRGHWRLALLGGAGLLLLNRPPLRRLAERTLRSGDRMNYGQPCF
jgi:hypothetical protein